MMQYETSMFLQNWADLCEDKPPKRVNAQNENQSAPSSYLASYSAWRRVIVVVSAAVVVDIRWWSRRQIEYALGSHTFASVC